MNDIAQKLQMPFKGVDIQRRVQQARKLPDGNHYVTAIPYISYRAIQKRLNEVFGPFG
jgi:hypothetical protein